MGWGGAYKGSGKKGSSTGKGSSFGKGKGGGSSKGQWAWIPVQSNYSKGGWGGKSGKKGGKSGGKKKMVPFSELSDERKEEIRQKHEEKRGELGRESAGNLFYFGEVVSRVKRFGWIKPTNFAKLPKNVQAKVKKMVADKKAKALESQGNPSVFKDNVLFLHMSDVEEGVKISVGDKVKFKVYVDSEGAGAEEVTSS
eukprot:TRINITY_DN9294_c0_g1_i1.p1 TRINITY_DN9294_c0_g1~~TRINITY_DN9294_c0_g1_i1.p1  ORF type:complete len:219 (-),score=60.12 TRINITY_DN9294_c0_g1_i1:166-756(-)